MNEKEKKYLGFLNSKFNENNFIEFIQDLLNLETNDFSIKEENNIQDTFKEYIKRYKKIASYTIGVDRIGVFIVEINDSTTSRERVSRARVKQRNYIATLLDNYGLDASIVAFYSVLESAWRISFVKREIELTDKGIKQNVSPARRYSYLVGEHESTHTAQEYLFNLLKNNENKFTISEIEEQFNVEKVTKRFFEQYKEKFLNLKDYLDGNEDFQTEAIRCDFDSAEFAKKLMGQIVFLYFLQKKGWLGVQLIPNELSKEDFNILINSYSNDIISQNLLKQFFCEYNEKFVVDSSKFRFNELNEDIINLTNIFKNTKYNMPWGTGDKKFIRTIFNKAIEENKNFFDDYLEAFFYTGLNKPRENQFFPLFNCKIPFLNGGLFEELNNYRWSSAHFNIPNELFSNTNSDGILDFLDLYNFTIDEEEPLEKEVAVDPEMLGKIFENLLEINDRKSKGAFYTPREIVYYMCQETLANYLVNKVNVNYDEMITFIKYGDIISQYDWDLFNNNKYEFQIGKSLYENIINLDEALISVKIADPAVGSGAFPLGMVTEIVKLRTNIQTYFLIQNDLKIINIDDYYNTEHLISDPYQLKLQTIENSIYAVDIESSAVDIAKLRLWLSLIVDYPNTEEPRPLPNLDYKIMQGDSLLDEYEGVQLFSDRILNNFLKKYRRNSEEKEIKGISIQFNLLNQQEDLDKQMKQLIAYQTELFKTSDSNRKKQLKRAVEDIQLGIIGISLENNRHYQTVKKLMEKNQKPWFIWKLEFFDVFKDNGGFDIVIGNPPYIGEEGNKELFQNICTSSFGKKYYNGKMDFWYFFTSKGLELLKENGTLSFIAPNNWMTTAGGKKMRKDISENATIKRFINFNNTMVFETASQQTMIFLLEKNNNIKSYKIKYKEIGNVNLNSDELSNFLNTDNIGNTWYSNYVRNNQEDGSNVYFLNDYIGNILDKIKSKGDIFLFDSEMTNGIHPHHAEVTKKMLEVMPDANVGDGIFILNREEIAHLNLNEDEKKLLKPYFDSNNIGRYYFNDNNSSYIIYTDSKYKDPLSMNNYPNLKRHLDKYSKLITSDNKPYGLHRARKQEFFEGKKIVSLRKCKVPTFSYIDGESYVTAEWYIIKTNRVNNKYLTCLLNSELIKFWLLKMGKMQGFNFQVDKEPLTRIPIRIPDNDSLSMICSYYDSIEGNMIDKEVDHEYEKNVDTLIYKLYDLSDEEITTIKQELKKLCEQ